MFMMILWTPRPNDTERGRRSRAPHDKWRASPCANNHSTCSKLSAPSWLHHALYFLLEDDRTTLHAGQRLSRLLYNAACRRLPLNCVERPCAIFKALNAPCTPHTLHFLSVLSWPWVSVRTTLTIRNGTPSVRVGCPRVQAWQLLSWKMR